MVAGLLSVFVPVLLASALVVAWLFMPTEGRARAALVVVLDAWRMGRAPSELVKEGSVANVIDPDFGRFVLLRYELGPVLPIDRGYVFHVTRFYQTRGGIAEVKSVANYAVTKTRDRMQWQVDASPIGP